MTKRQYPGTKTSNNAEPLRGLGWDDHFEKQCNAANCGRENVARVLSVRRNRLLVGNGLKEWLCAPSGKMLHRESGVIPVTGDWVIANEAMALGVLQRKNSLSRGEVGERGKLDEGTKREQLIGANIDVVFIVCGMDRDFSLRRIERYLTLVYNCGMNPVIALTKSDLSENPEEMRRQADEVAFGAPVVLTSMVDQRGIDALRGYLGHGRTVAMIGSSGAGKSTLANMLQGAETQATAEVSLSVGKGRHTTTARELIAMPRGGLLMDNPGIREIAFYTDDDGLETAFPDIQALSEACRFSDCSHEQEPGCAVLRAVASGELQSKRLESYRKMQREMRYVAARSEKSADRVEKERWKDIAIRIRRLKEA